MTWLVFKTFAKKTWIWTKEHWQIPFLVAWSIAVYVLTRRNTDALVEVIEAKKDSYKKQLDVLRKTHNDEILKRDGLTKKYEEALVALESEFEKKERELSEDQKEEIKEVVARAKGNPDEIKRRIEKEFGIRFED